MKRVLFHRPTAAPEVFRWVWGEAWTRTATAFEGTDYYFEDAVGSPVEDGDSQIPSPYTQSPGDYGNVFSGTVPEGAYTGDRVMHVIAYDDAGELVKLGEFLATYSCTFRIYCGELDGEIPTSFVAADVTGLRESSLQTTLRDLDLTFPATVSPKHRVIAIPRSLWDIAFIADVRTLVTAVPDPQTYGVNQVLDAAGDEITCTEYYQHPDTFETVLINDIWYVLLILPATASETTVTLRRYTITAEQFVQAPSATPDWTYNGSVTLFDTAVGELIAVSFRTQTTGSMRVRMENLDGPQTVNVTLLDTTTVSAPGPATIATLTTQIAYEDTFVAFDGSDDFLGTSGRLPTYQTPSDAEDILHAAGTPVATGLTGTGTGTVTIGCARTCTFSGSSTGSDPGGFHVAPEGARNGFAAVSYIYYAS